MPIDDDVESARNLATELTGRMQYLRRKRDLLTKEIVALDQQISSITAEGPTQAVGPSTGWGS